MEQGASLGQVGGAGRVGEEAIVADAVEAGGQDVDQEAADELAGCQGHQLAPGLAVLAVVLPAELSQKLPEAIELMISREKVILDACKREDFNYQVLRQAIMKSAKIH